MDTNHNSLKMKGDEMSCGWNKHKVKEYWGKAVLKIEEFKKKNEI